MLNFTLSDKQVEQWHEFQEKHKDCCRKRTGRPIASPIGGGFEIIFTPTGIGDGVTFKCNFCGKTENATDYDMW